MGIEAFIQEHGEAYVQVDDVPVQLVDEEVEVEDEEVELKRVRSTMRVLIRYHSYCYDIRD
jgi:hypothetical protein